MIDIIFILINVAIIGGYSAMVSEEKLAHNPKEREILNARRLELLSEYESFGKHLD